MNLFNTCGLIICFLATVSGFYYDTYYKGCDYSRCNYYAQLTRLPSSQLQSAGYRLFYQCNCPNYGISLYNVRPTQAPYQPVTQAPYRPTQAPYRPTQAPYRPTQAPYVPVTQAPQRQCGVSQVTGSASYYLSLLRGRVVGGENAKDCEFPFLAYVNAGGSQCGGTIIDSRHIVTAAHCMVSGGSYRPASSVTVGVGSSYKNNLRTYRVSRVTVHPNYQPNTFDYDVAVLTLSSTLSTSQCVQSACLPTPSLQLQTDTKCMVVGWGLTQYPGGYSPNNAQKAMVPIISMNTCKQSYGSNTINDLKICAGYLSGDKDACKGDSGGPLLCAEGSSWTLAGIVSFGNGCAKPNYPGVYAYVPNLKTWIDSITRSQ